MLGDVLADVCQSRALFLVYAVLAGPCQSCLFAVDPMRFFEGLDLTYTRSYAIFTYAWQPCVFAGDFCHVDAHIVRCLLLVFLST